MAKMPLQKPGSSKQDYATPKEFLDAVRNRFGNLSWDLAAHSDNVIEGANGYFSPEENSLAQDWRLLDGNLWLNPPFGDIGIWAEKCADEASVRTCGWTHFLVPASVGSNWFKNFCWNRGYISYLSPRMSFDGLNVYPKDLILVTYRSNVCGSETWRWDVR